MVATLHTVQESLHIYYSILGTTAVEEGESEGKEEMFETRPVQPSKGMNSVLHNTKRMCAL